MVWVHADLTRKEFLLQLNPQINNKVDVIKRPVPKNIGHPTQVCPLTISGDSTSLTRRLFTHLFLPSDALCGWIRAVLWLGIPSHELSIMLVDWSSLSYVGQRSRCCCRRRRCRRLYDNIDDSDTDGIVPISPITAPVFLSILMGQWGSACWLVFGQVLVAGQRNVDVSKNGILIHRRNDRARRAARGTVVIVFVG